MRYIIVIVFSLIVVFPLNSYSDCIKDQSGNVVCGPGQCATDQYKNVYCAAAGGGAINDSYREVQCGIGACAQDNKRKVWCSKEPGGGAAKGSDGKVKCFGGCMEGAQEYCQLAE